MRNCAGSNYGARTHKIVFLRPTSASLVTVDECDTSTYVEFIATPYTIAYIWFHIVVSNDFTIRSRDHTSMASAYFWPVRLIGSWLCCALVPVFYDPIICCRMFCAHSVISTPLCRGVPPTSCISTWWAANSDVDVTVPIDISKFLSTVYTLVFEVLNSVFLCLFCLPICLHLFDFFLLNCFFLICFFPHLFSCHSLFFLHLCLFFLQLCCYLFLFFRHLCLHCFLL